MMRKVYVCAPLGGDVESNLKKVRTYTEYALRCSTAPVVPHFYAECLDDNDPKDREIGLAAGCRFCGSATSCGCSEMPSQTA